MSKISTVLITGASSGIGLELARLFAADRHRLLIVGRNPGRLDAAAAELARIGAHSVTAFEFDLEKPESVPKLHARLLRENVRVDILVNNAAFGSYGLFAESEPEAALGMIQLNIASLVHLTRLLLPAMIAARSGGIVNIGSGAGFVPGPFFSVYHATKAFVLSFSESLAQELKSTGVGVTLVCPGPTVTEFQARAGIGISPGSMDARNVALEGYRGWKRGKRIVITGASHRASIRLSRIVPRSLLPGIMEKRYLREAARVAAAAHYERDGEIKIVDSALGNHPASEKSPVRSG